MEHLGSLMLKADSYNPIFSETDRVEYQYDVFHSVWEQASKLRREGRLLELGQLIQCPVVAMHGDYDPHPYSGVDSLSNILKDFRLILLEKCGHRPWIERNARKKFYSILRNEIM
ncbi:alpha/beta fold hydrolase [Chloroflexota bacterium]